MAFQISKVFVAVGVLCLATRTFGGSGDNTTAAELTDGLTQILFESLPPVISIVVLGRRGAGITSTVRQLLGPKTTIHAAHVAVASTDILEYTLRIPAPDDERDYYFLKLIDVPGLVADNTVEDDAEILASLKAYLHDKGLPAFFIVVSRFDEKHISDKDSLFGRLLERVEYFQGALFETATDNTIFLLTRLLNEPLDVQQNPAGQIDTFREVVQSVTTLPTPIEILVGDNKPDEASAKMEQGYYRFPNHELYPKNIWTKMLEVAGRNFLDHEGNWYKVIRHVLQFMIESREKDLHCQEQVPHAEDETLFEEDIQALQYILTQTNLDLPCNEIQRRLHSSFEKEEAEEQMKGTLQFFALQLHLRNERFANLAQLPQSASELANFFKMDGMTSIHTQHFLKKAFNIDLPEFPSGTTMGAGYGYDVASDRQLRRTPFNKDPVKPSSSIGYSFPNFIRCGKLESVQEKLLIITESLHEYSQERLKLLGLADQVNMTLTGATKPYTNILTNKLVVVKEFRNLECNVNNLNLTTINEDFTSAVVNSLPPLNISDSESVSDWKMFLLNFGTHVVTKNYGGGYYEGQVTTDDISIAIPLSSKTNLTTLEGIGNLENLEDQGDQKTTTTQIYKFHGGNVDPAVFQIHKKESAEKERLLSDWKRTLDLQFEPLTNEMNLIPISQIIASINALKGEDAKRATDLFLHGNLDTQQHTGPEETDDPKLLMANARVQALTLQSSHAEETVKKLNQFTEFMNEVETNT